MTVSLDGVFAIHSRFETLKSGFKCASAVPIHFLKRYNACSFCH